MLAKLFLMMVLLIPVAACLSSGNASPTPTILPPPQSYEKAMYTVERGPIVADASLSGHIWPYQHHDLHFRSSGFVTRVTVSEGDGVKIGDMLAELQVDDLLSQLGQAQIDLEAAKTQLAETEKSREYAIERAQRQVNIQQLQVEMIHLSIDENAESPGDLAKSQLQLAMAEENLALARIALAEASEEVGQNQKQGIERMELERDRLEAQLAERQIHAPYNGIVLERHITPGDQVSAFMKALVLGDPAELVVRARQESQLLEKVDEGSEIYMYLPSDTTTRYEVKYMPDFSLLSDDSGAGAGRDWMYFSLPSSLERDVFPVGKPIRLTIVLGRNDDALFVPPAAVHEFRGRRYVIVRDGERQRRVDVRVGLRTNDYWEIIGDVNEGDQVVGP
jgi:multidrug efflux pump subunit AcrA (membrane-fusion protein)